MQYEQQLMYYTYMMLMLIMCRDWIVNNVKKARGSHILQPS